MSENIKIFNSGLCQNEKIITQLCRIYAEIVLKLNKNQPSSEKTLNDKDLEKINNSIIEAVENKTGAKIRA